MISAKSHRVMQHISSAALVAMLAIFCSHCCVAEEITRTAESGPVRVTTRLSPSDPRIGDEVLLELTVIAEKDIEVLMPEFQQHLERFSIAEYVPSQQIDAQGNTTYVQRYKLLTERSGEQAIPPILVEFVDNRPGKPPAPEGEAAYEIETERINFQVQSVVPEGVSAELKPPLGRLEPPASGIASSQIPWIIGLACVCLAGICVFLWTKRHRQKQKANAYVLAHLRLERLLATRANTTDPIGVEQFFVQISSIIRRYLEDRFSVRAPELTTDEFLQLASAHEELLREHQTLLSEFLKQADTVKFAGVRATEADIQRSTALAKQFLEATRENAPDVEIGEEVVPNQVEQPATEEDATSIATGPREESSHV